MEIYYYVMKVFLFGSFVRSLVKFEPLQKSTLALSLVYTALVAFLSFVFLLTQSKTPDFSLWQYWLVANFLLTLVYFKLIVRFDETRLFWLILPLGVVVIFNEPNLVPFWLRLLPV